MRRFAILSIAVLAALPGAVRAQSAGDFMVAPTVGWQRYDSSAALQDGVVGGLEALYGLTDVIGLGAYVQVGRPLTDGSFFPLIALPFGDSTYHYLPDQRVTQMGIGAMATLRIPLNAPLRPYVVGGAGATRFLMDVEQNRGEKKKAFATWTVGGGVEFDLATGSGVRLDVRDQVYTSFDRSIFNVGDPLYTDPVFVNDKSIPAAKSTVHNLRFAVEFSLVPGAGR